MRYDATKETDKEVLREHVKLLQEKVIALEKINVAREEQLKQEEQLLQKLSEELKNLRDRVFNSRQERAKSTPKIKRQKTNLPHNQSVNLPLEQCEVDLDEEVTLYPLKSCLCPKCGGDNLKEMNSFEESSEIDLVERKYLIRRHKRHKYSCPDCKNVITAPGGVKLTPGGEYSIQLATQIACDKFEDHIPLERQRKQLGRAGICVDVKTLYGLTEHLYARIFPLEELIRQDVLSEKWVHLDESPMDFYNPTKSRGFMWSMSNPRGAYYKFEPTRSGAVAREMLGGFDFGVVVTDGFSGYDFLDKNKNLKHAFCWAHVRRKFFEAIAHDKRAKEVVNYIDELYKVEHEAKEIDDLELLRKTKSSPIVQSIDQWIESMDGKFLETSSLGKAIHYYRGRVNGLHYFLSDKFVPIDNNMAERRQRCPVMGRKNFLHFKSINGADVGALFYSIVESCKSNGLDARSYIGEMARRCVRGDKLESPFNYGKRLSAEIESKLSSELASLKK